jgi:hypothetical protein
MWTSYFPAIQKFGCRTLVLFKGAGFLPPHDSFSGTRIGVYSQFPHVTSAGNKNPHPSQVQGRVRHPKSGGSWKNILELDIPQENL